MEVAGMGWQRYVALGDSFTEGIGDPGPDGRDRGGLTGWRTRWQPMTRCCAMPTSRSAGVEWPKSSKSRCQRRAS